MSLPWELPEIVHRNNEGRKIGIRTAVYEIRDLSLFFKQEPWKNQSLSLNFRDRSLTYERLSL